MKMEKKRDVTLKRRRMKIEYRGLVKCRSKRIGIEMGKYNIKMKRKMAVRSLTSHPYI